MEEKKQDHPKYLKGGEQCRKIVPVEKVSSQPYPKQVAQMIHVWFLEDVWNHEKLSEHTRRLKIEDFHLRINERVLT